MTTDMLRDDITGTLEVTGLLMMSQVPSSWN